MKYLKMIVLAIPVLIGFTGCDKNFRELNVDPNVVSQITPTSLLSESVYGMVANNATNNYNVNDPMMQIQVPYPELNAGVQRYHIDATSGTSTWNAGYKWAMNIHEMLKSSVENGATNYEAVGLTLNAWIYANLTDCFGSVPFSQASQSEDGLQKPVYDSQESIYNQLLSDLEKANTLYDHTIGMSYAGTDILYNNDSRLWQKFTNSLRLRLLLRVSGVRATAYQEMKTMIEDPVKYPVFTQLSDGAVLNITGVTPNLSPWSRALDFSNSHAVGEFFIETLNSLNDPRRPVYVTQAHGTSGDAIGYKGIPAGYDPNTVFGYSPSYMNNVQVTPPMIIPILTYAEVEFIKAELAQKGYLQDDAETHYKNGVKAAIQLWTKTTVADDYFNNPLAAYDGTLERIMLQKYLALYFTDFQQWDEYRRTGFPVLPTTAVMENGAKVPSRLMYPDIQSTYNPDNYNKASQEMGNNSINAKVWWDN